MLNVSQNVMKYNLAAHNANIQVISRFIERENPSIVADPFIEAVARLPNFPFLTIKEIVKASRASDTPLVAKYAAVEELNWSNIPALLFINRLTNLPYSLEAIEVIGIKGQGLVLSDYKNRPFCMSLSELAGIFSGIVLISSMTRTCCSPKDYFHSDSIFNLHRNFMSVDDCLSLVDLLEKTGFVTIPASDRVTTFSVDTSPRPSILGCRLDHHDSQSHLVKQLKTSVARLVGCDIARLEGPECIRISAGCGTFRRFDSGVNLRRRRSIHIALKCREGGISMDFTHLQSVQSLDIGDAIVIESCEEDGRTNWRSEWSPLPPLSGAIYMVSCWSG